LVVEYNVSDQHEELSEFLSGIDWNWLIQVWNTKFWGAYIQALLKSIQSGIDNSNRYR
jgi:hypothetical protein